MVSRFRDKKQLLSGLHVPRMDTHSVTMNETKTRFVRQQLYLGVTISGGLTLTSAVDRFKTKLLTIVLLINLAAGTTCGAPVSYLLCLYQKLFVNLIHWGLAILNVLCKIVIKTLIELQARRLRSCFSPKSETTTGSMLNLVNPLSMLLKCKKHCTFTYNM